METLLTEAFTFDGATGEVVIDLEGYRIESNTSVDLLLVCVADGLVAGGQSFSVSLQSVNDVKAYSLMPPSATAVPGTASGRAGV